MSEESVLGKRRERKSDDFDLGHDSGSESDADGLIGFRPAPSEPKLNSQVIDSKKSTTFINNFSKYTARIRVENHVFTTNIGRPINLRAFLRKTAITHGSQYNPKRFAALVIRWRDPRIALLFFSCGKLVCSGAKNRFQARIVTKDAIRLVREIGYTDVDIKKVHAKLQNMVCSVILKFAVDLDELACERKDICKYDREIFPGASLKIPRLGSINVSVYSAGRLIITGAKEIRDIKRAIKAVLPILLKHKREITMDPITKLNSKSKHEEAFKKNAKINYEIEVRKNKIRRKEKKEASEKYDKIVSGPIDQIDDMDIDAPISNKLIAFTEGGIDCLMQFKESNEDDDDNIPLFKSTVNIETVSSSVRSMLPL